MEWLDMAKAYGGNVVLLPICYMLLKSHLDNVPAEIKAKVDLAVTLSQLTQEIRSRK